MLNLINEGTTTHVKRITEEEELQLIDEEMQLVDAEAQLIDAVDDVDLRMQSTCQRHMTFKRSKWILRHRTPLSWSRHRTAAVTSTPPIKSRHRTTVLVQTSYSTVLVLSEA